MGIYLPDGQPELNGRPALTTAPLSRGDDLAEDIRLRHHQRRVLNWFIGCKIGVRPRKRTARATVRALEAEHEMLGVPPGTLGPTYGETVVRAAATKTTQGILGRTARRVARRVGRIDRLKARRATLRDRIGSVHDGYVAHCDGGNRTLEEAKHDHDALQAQLWSDYERRSYRHDRPPRFFRWMPRIVLVFDLLLLLYFFAGITDVDWQAPWSVPLAFAAGLAAMITIVSYGCLAFAGYLLRGHKDHARRIPIATLDWLTSLVTIAAVVGIVVLATLMFVRMRSEVVLALGPGSGTTATVVAAGLAAVSVLANIMVIAVHARDGSEESDRLRALARAVRKATARETTLRLRQQRLDYVIARRTRAAERIAADGRTRAGQPMSVADRLIDTARIPSAADPVGPGMADPNTQQGITGYRQRDTAPQPDARPLYLALDHLDTDLHDQLM